MSEWRADPVTGHWVVVAADVPVRRRDFDLDESPPDADGPCPLCEGHEPAAGREILAVRTGTPADGPGWDLRVVANRVPALRVEAAGGRHHKGVLASEPGLGAHEVVVESPRHDLSWYSMSEQELTRVLVAWRDRIADLRHDSRMQCAAAFKNHGAKAGARLAHPHSQVVALPKVPPRVEDEVEGAVGHHDRTGRCVYCELVEQELEDGSRVVGASGDCVALTPYASRSPFEVWLVPTPHVARVEAASVAVLAGVASMLRSVLGRMSSELGRPAFNAVLHTAPYGALVDASYHWHLELVPRVLRSSGFELATGTAVNPVAPEKAARVLRGATAS